MNSEGDREVKEVLVIFDSRRRPVKFVCYRANPYETYQSLFNAVEKAFCDVLAAEEGSSTSEGGFFTGGKQRMGWDDRRDCRDSS